MSEFILLFRGGNPRDTDFSPEQFQRHMKDWGMWVQSLHEQGIFKAGESLAPDGGRVVDPGLAVTDGPFCESKELVGGFVIVQAADLDAATELAKGCPVLQAKGSVEIRQLLPSP